MHIDMQAWGLKLIDMIESIKVRGGKHKWIPSDGSSEFIVILKIV